MVDIDNTEIDIYVGAKLKEFRKQKNMTQEELAQLLNITKQSISRYEKGERNISNETLVELSKILGMPIQKFFPSKTKIKVTFEIIGEIPLYNGIKKSILFENSVTDSKHNPFLLPEFILPKLDRKDLFAVIIDEDFVNNIIPLDSMIICQRLQSIDELDEGDLIIFSYKEATNREIYGLMTFRKHLKDELIIFSPNSTDKNFRDIVVPFKEINQINLYGKVAWYSVTL